MLNWIYAGEVGMQSTMCPEQRMLLLPPLAEWVSCSFRGVGMLRKQHLSLGVHRTAGVISATLMKVWIHACFYLEAPIVHILTDLWSLVVCPFCPHHFLPLSLPLDPSLSKPVSKPSSELGGCSELLCKTALTAKSLRAHLLLQIYMPSEQQ